MNVVIFRENTEDVYAGIEWKSGTPEVKKLIDFLNNEMLKGDQKEGPRGFRRGHQADFADRHQAPGAPRDPARDRAQSRTVVTLVHKGNIMKFTEGAFRDWGYELATEEFREQVVTERESWILGNKDRDANLTIEQNAAMIEPGLEQATEDFKKTDLRRSETNAR